MFVQKEDFGTDVVLTERRKSNFLSQLFLHAHLPLMPCRQQLVEVALMTLNKLLSGHFILYYVFNLFKEYQQS